MLTRRGFLKSVVGAALAIGSGVLPQAAQRVERRLPAWLRHRPIDLYLAEECGRRVAAEIERHILYGSSEVPTKERGHWLQVSRSIPTTW